MRQHHQRPGSGRHLRALGIVAAAIMILAGCGPFNGDEGDPTSTPASIPQATTGATEETATSDAQPTGEPTQPMGTPDASQATPGEPRATPASPFLGRLALDEATPESDLDDAGLAGEATPDSTGAAAEDSGQADGPGADAADLPAFSGSDGTSGATPAGSLVDASPDATAVADNGTPGTPGLVITEETVPAQEVDLAAIEPVAVDSCEPGDVAPLLDGAVTYVTNSNVNFRTGPGSDCETIGDGPLGPSLPVAVISAPVVREGEEDFTWVQVEINDITGWVVLDALDPAD
jgi:hypothetical protein